MNNSQFESQFLMSIHGLIPDEFLPQIKNSLSVVLTDYEITPKCTDIVLYEAIPECLEIYIISKKVEGIKNSTLKLYNDSLRIFFRYTNKNIKDIVSGDIRKFMYLYQKQTGNSDRTMDMYRTIIQSFFKWASIEGIIASNPCENIRPVKYVPKERTPLSSVEMELVRNAFDNARDRAIFEFIYSTGCRVSELARIKFSDVDFQKNEVLLLGKGDKYRKSYISQKAMYYLKAYLDSRTDDNVYLFVSKRKPYNKLEKAAIEKVFREVGKKSGINRQLFPHLVRHTTATDCLTKGMDVAEIQKILGHSNISTTMIYAKTTDRDIKNKHERCMD